MQLTPGMFLIVLPMVFLASLVDAIAGGGGLISLPAYTLAGLDYDYLTKSTDCAHCKVRIYKKQGKVCVLQTFPCLLL